MKISGKVVVVSGGGQGIGRAMCERFAADGAEHVVVSDINRLAADEVADKIGGTANVCDATAEHDVRRLIEETIDAHGRIDLFCANAGITVKGGIEIPDSEWQKLWDVNLMSRVYAARHLIPHLLASGGGYYVSTASGAALLTEVGSAPYSVTKHADLAFAEWLAIRYGREGLKVSCLCPLGVQTDFLDHDDPIHRYLSDTSMTADDVAAAVVAAIDEEQFLITPQQSLQDFFELKSRHYDRYIYGMQKMQEKWGGRAA